MLFDQADPEPAHGRITGDPATDDAAANHQDVQWAFLERCESSGSWLIERHTT